MYNSTLSPSSVEFLFHIGLWAMVYVRYGVSGQSPHTNATEAKTVATTAFMSRLFWNSMRLFPVNSLHTPHLIHWPLHV